MAETTNISWCDRTWSPWYGCTQVSMGDHGACVGCYARDLSEHRFHRVVFGGPGRGEGTRAFRPDSAWAEPLRWERQAAEAYRAWTENGHVPPAPEVFVFPSLCDPFDNHSALADERRRFFDLIRATPHLTWLLLTKRPGNIVKLFTEALSEADKFMLVDPPLMSLAECWPRNAAIGFTAVTQPEMDRDSRHALAAFRALNPAFLFWSGEPLLAPVIIPDELLELGGRFWAITGGETDQGKHKARPSHPDWFRSLRDQCAAAGVAYHHKQNGEWAHSEDTPPPAPGPQFFGAEGAPKGNGWHFWTDGDQGANASIKVGKKAAGRLLDGVAHDARPEVRHG